MALADTLSATAIRLLNQYGNAVVITQETPGAYDPTTSSMAVTTQTMTIKGLPEEYAESMRFLGEKLNTPNAISENDKKLTIQGTALAFTPKVGDKCTITAEAKTYAITGVGKVWVNDICPILVLHIRAV